MIDLSYIAHSPNLTSSITIERTTGGYLDKSTYKANPPTRFKVQGVFVPDELRSISPSELGARATGQVSFLCDQSVALYTTHDLADGNDISDRIITEPGTANEAAYRIISVNAAFGVRVVTAQRVGAI
jgi:hypothetical protein